MAVASWLPDVAAAMFAAFFDSDDEYTPVSSIARALHQRDPHPRAPSEAPE